MATAETTIDRVLFVCPSCKQDVTGRLTYKLNVKTAPTDDHEETLRRNPIWNAIDIALQPELIGLTIIHRCENNKPQPIRGPIQDNPQA